MCAVYFFLFSLHFSLDFNHIISTDDYIGGVHTLLLFIQKYIFKDEHFHVDWMAAGKNLSKEHILRHVITVKVCTVPTNIEREHHFCVELHEFS